MKIRASLHFYLCQLSPMLLVIVCTFGWSKGIESTTCFINCMFLSDFIFFWVQRSEEIVEGKLHSTVCNRLQKCSYSVQETASCVTAKTTEYWWMVLAFQLLNRAHKLPVMMAVCRRGFRNLNVFSRGLFLARLSSTQGAFTFRSEAAKPLKD